VDGFDEGGAAFVAGGAGRGAQPVSHALPGGGGRRRVVVGGVGAGRGVLLELCPEPAPKPEGVKNRLHLDIRLEAGDDPDAVVARVLELGGRGLDPDWGELPWRVMTDPSGNELCLLPARAA